MKPNRFKRALRESQNGLAVGTMVFEFATSGLARVIGAAELDFVIYDMEHSGFGFDTMRMLLSTAQGADFTPLVRVPTGDYHFLARVVDAGAAGVMVPMVETAQQAAAVVDAVKYAPEGHRGVAFGVAHDDFRPEDGLATMAHENREMAVILLIETSRGIDNVEEIAAVPGVDVLWLGHFDLSQSLGVTAQFTHPDFIAAVRRLVDAAQARGLPAGIMAADTRAADDWIGQGFRAIAYGGDIWLYQRALREGVTYLRGY